MSSEIIQEIRTMLREARQNQPEMLQPEEFAKATAKFYYALRQEGLSEELAKELTMAYVAGG